MALAGVGSRTSALVEELADLWFHSYVLLAARGLDPERVEEELRRRHQAESPPVRPPALRGSPARP